MKSCLIHGCYDEVTLKTLLQMGRGQLAFDLRPRSSNLVAYRDLVQMLSLLNQETVVLVFENDLPSTVLSYLDLLKNTPSKFVLEFRDNLPPAIYSSFHHDFYWMFHPDHDWKSILSLPEAKGVLLPLKYKHIYATMPDLWNLIDEKNLRVFLHAENLGQTADVAINDGVEISLDLTPEIETHYRKVDQERLKSNPFWRKLNENITRQ